MAGSEATMALRVGATAALMERGGIRDTLALCMVSWLSHHGKEADKPQPDTGATAEPLRVRVDATQGLRLSPWGGG